jgi:thioredoxin-like negative regulator of GroEL
MSAALSLGLARFELSKTAVLLVALTQIFMLAPGVARAASIPWQSDYRDALQESASRRLPVLVVIGARWCRYCRTMQSETFCNPAVTARITSHFIPLLIDADEQEELVEKFKVSAFPTVLIISPERLIVDRYSGFQSAAQLDRRLACYRTAAAKPR